MRILALIGSPRKGSNTEILVNEILKGGRRSGYTSKKIYLYDHKILPCVDCRACKRGDFVCPISDGMKEIYPEMERANLIIFGTPNYWYGPTGVTKLLIDRMRPFVENGKLKDKRWVLVTPAAEGAKVCKPLVEMLRMSFAYLGMKFAGKILAKAYEKAEIRENRGELERAYKLGVSL